ncbi:MAG: hypothetical protein HZT39_01010 [Pseudoxanthomonas sp.]|nr:MAG: hypothetical protein HZT39_01010 [Pseudoxanthomonas sp.]
MSPPIRCRAIALQPRCGGVERGDASVAGGKKFAQFGAFGLVRREIGCLSGKNFARVQAAGAVVAEVARRSRQPRNIIGAPDPDEEKARFLDVFFLRASKRRKPRLTGSSGAGAPSVRRRDQVRTGERKSCAQVLTP